MKILFINLPYEFNISRSSRWPEKTKSGTLYYPYWLAHAAAVCIKEKVDTYLIDSIAKKHTTEDMLEAIAEIKPDYIVTEITTSTLKYDYEVLGRIKNEFPSTKLLVAGTHATVLSEEVLSECKDIDVILRKEYDFTVLDAVNNFNKLNKVLGITYREKGKIIKNDDRPEIDDLDKLPNITPVYEKFLDPHDYFYAFAKHPMIQIFSTRGCPFRCNFCSYPQSMTGRKLRTRSVKNFVDELEYIEKEMPYIKEIFIEDDTFTVDKKRVIDICDEIIKRDLKITWSANSRADLTYDVMEKMKEAGCRLLVVGYESGSQEVLNKIKKGITLEQSIEFAKSTKKLKIKVFGCFMIGLTGDDRETIEETFKFAKKVYPDMVFFQQAVPFPGTDFYNWCKENKMLKTEDFGEWLNSSGYLDCLVNYKDITSEEIEKIRDRLMTRYYFSFTYIFKTFLKNLSWSEFKRVVRAGSTYIWFRIKKVFKK